MPLTKKLSTSVKKNTKRRSIKRKSIKRMSAKRMSKDQLKVKECIKRKRRSRVLRRSPKCSIDKCYSAWRRATKC